MILHLQNPDFREACANLNNIQAVPISTLEQFDTEALRELKGEIDSAISRLQAYSENIECAIEEKNQGPVGA
jgi:hypothetical protein